MNISEANFDDFDLTTDYGRARVLWAQLQEQDRITEAQPPYRGQKCWQYDYLIGEGDKTRWGSLYDHDNKEAMRIAFGIGDELKRRGLPYKDWHSVAALKRTLTAMIPVCDELA